MRLPRPARLLLALAAPAAAAAQPDSAARVARADQLFARWATGASPGCAVEVREGGRTRLARAYGMADLEHAVPNTPATLFEAGSVSKQFTAAAALLLVQRGRIGLDDDVRKYVPELPDYSAQGGPVTVRHLFHHTSGLRDWGTVMDAAGWPRTTRAYTNDDVVEIAARQKSLNYPVGAEYSYTNTGYNLLAVIVARVSGVPFAEFTRRELFAPLGMTRTQWRDDHTRVVPDRAVAYARRADGYHTLMPFESAHGNGGLITTVSDLQKWIAALEGTAPADSTLPRPLAAALQERGRLTNGRTITYARGLVVDTYRGVREVSHSGSTAGYRGWAALYPDQRLAVSLLCNTGEANPTRLGQQVADLFLEGAPGVVATNASASSSAGALPTGGGAPLAARRAGLYRDARTFDAVRVEARGDTLVAGNTRLLARSATEFASPNGARLAFAASGARPGAVLVSADGDSVRWEPVAPAAPDAAKLAEYAGTYRSDEADATWTAAVVDGTLVVRQRHEVTAPLTPTYADAFTGREAPIVWFTRDARGRVDAMHFGMGRVRDLRLAKVR
jgi:CubicO group peptidase (beta-lactamase class C family)